MIMSYLSIWLQEIGNNKKTTLAIDCSSEMLSLDLVLSYLALASPLVQSSPDYSLTTFSSFL